MIYFDNSATSFPKPDIVYQKMLDLYKKYGVNPHRGNYKLSFEAGMIVDETRNLVSQFFNGYGKNFVVFTLNATDALNMAIKGILEDGDEVITTVLEHNSVLRPLNHLKKEKNIKLKFLDIQDEEISITELKKSLSKRTKLVIVNHISNVTGYVQDIKAIGETVKNNSSAFFMVDASQSAGIMPIDQKDSKIDILITTGHKALYAPTGIGLMLLNPLVKIKPLRTGGSGQNSENPFQPDEMPDFLEAGTLNTLGIFGLKAGIEYIKEIGIENILKKELSLKNIFLEKLNSKDFKIFTSKKDSAPIISLTSSKYSPIELSTILDEHNIATRSGLHCAPLLHKSLKTFPEGTVRISFGYLNKEEEILELVKILNNL